MVGVASLLAVGCCLVGLVVVVGCWGWVSVLVLLWCCWCLLACAAAACGRLRCSAGVGLLVRCSGVVCLLTCCPAVVRCCGCGCRLAVVLVVLRWVLRFGGAAVGWWVLPAGCCGCPAVLCWLWRWCFGAAVGCRLVVVLLVLVWVLVVLRWLVAVLLAVAF